MSEFNGPPVATAKQLPKWQSADSDSGKKKNWKYTDYILVQLRHRFSQVSTQFQKLDNHIGDVLPQEERARALALLEATQKGLESKSPSLLEMSTQIMQLEKLLLEFIPDPYIETIAHTLKTKLELERAPQAGRLQEIMTSQTDPSLRPAALRTAMRQLIHERSLAMVKEYLISVNKLIRFRNLRSLMVALVVLMFAVSPFLFKEIDAYWRDSLMFNILEPFLPTVPAQGEAYFTALLISGVVMLMGALGGYLAGVFSQIDKGENVFEYNVDRFLSAIRPAIGALFALLLYLLVDWQVVPGLAIENAGTVIFVSFLIGFSAKFATSIFGKVMPGGGSAGGALFAGSAQPTDQVASSDTEMFGTSFTPMPSETSSPEMNTYPPATGYTPMPPAEPFATPQEEVPEQGPVNPSL
jgi:hypothetical protein